LPEDKEKALSLGARAAFARWRMPYNFWESGGFNTFCQRISNRASFSGGRVRIGGAAL